MRKEKYNMFMCGMEIKSYEAYCTIQFEYNGREFLAELFAPMDDDYFEDDIQGTCETYVPYGDDEVLFEPAHEYCEDTEYVGDGFEINSISCLEEIEMGEDLFGNDKDDIYASLIDFANSQCIGDMEEYHKDSING